MNIQTQPQSISDLIAAVGADLTPVERKIAAAIVAEPTLPAFGSVSDLAEHVGTSRPSIVRFAQKLGFDGYSELQEHVQRRIAQRPTRPSDRIREEGEPSALRPQLDEAIGSVYKAVEASRVNELIEPIVCAKQVWVLSGETSKAGGMAFHSGLSMLREGTHFLAGGSLEPNISSAGKGDVAVVFDFYRYRRMVTRATRLLSKAGVRIIAVTDSPLAPLVAHAACWRMIKVPAIGPFDSSMPVVLFAELLVAEISKALHDEATTRIDRIEELWEATDRFET